MSLLSITKAFASGGRNTEFRSCVQDEVRSRKRNRGSETIDLTPEEGTGSGCDTPSADSRINDPTGRIESQASAPGKKRLNRSSCWEHFEQKTVNGVRYAVCLLCKKMLKQGKAAGTGTLWHHIEMHMKHRTNSSRHAPRVTKVFRCLTRGSGRISCYGCLNEIYLSQRSRTHRFVTFYSP
jgi:hypothetical protein